MRSAASLASINLPRIPVDDAADNGQPLDYPLPEDYPSMWQGQKNVATFTGRGSNVQVHVDYGKGLLVIALCAAICGISVPFSMWAGYQASVMTTEYRVELNHRMEMEAQQRVMNSQLEKLNGHR